MWFPVDHFIHEISCIRWPPCWYILFFHIHLLWKDMISDFFSWFTNIRSLKFNFWNYFPHHAFICYHSQCKIISWKRMVLSTDHFWSYKKFELFVYTYNQVYRWCLGNYQILVLLQYQSQLFWDILIIFKILFLPSLSKTIFSGLISRWINFFLWMYSRPEMMQAMKNSNFRSDLTSLMFRKSSFLAYMVSKITSSK